MLQHEPELTGFTTWTAEGHGLRFDEASAREKVRGRIARQVITAVLEQRTAAALIERIAKDAPFPHLIYWLEPVLQFGRMTDAPRDADASSFPKA